MTNPIIAFWMALALAAAPADSPPAGAAETPSGPGGEQLRAIALHYPEEHRRLLEEWDRAAGDEAAAVEARTRLLAAFYGRHAPGLRNAPAEILLRLNAMQLALIRRLAREDVGLCADFAAGAFAGRLDLPAAYQADASALGALIVEAARLGETRPRDGESEALTEGDAFIWYSQLLREEPSTELDIADARPGEESRELECRVGLASLNAVSKLPADQAASVGGSLLSQILAAGPD